MERFDELLEKISEALDTQLKCFIAGVLLGAVLGFSICAGMLQ